MRSFLLLVFLCSLGVRVLASASLPTKFPTVVSPSQFPMLPLEQDEWQYVHNALRGSWWRHCNSSYSDPCSFAATNCLSPIRVVCDQNKRIFEIILPNNNLTGQLPESSLQVLGRNLKLLDLSGNPGIVLPRGRICVQLDFCFREGVRCRLDFPLCERLTPGPTVNPPMNPSDAYLYTLMQKTLTSSSSSNSVMCPYSPHLTCVLADGELYISELSLTNLGLTGFFPYEESTLGFLSKLTKFDISNNPELDLEWNDDDCFRFDACLPNGGVQCNFTNTQLKLCSAPALPSIDSQITGLRISDELLAYWQWFYLLLNMSSLADPECFNAGLLYTDPCSACPRRIVCVPGQGSGLLVFHSILLGNAQLQGQISSAPLQRFFNLGLQRFSLASTNASLANVVMNVNATAPCLHLPPCSQLECDFAGLITVCGDEGSSPTVSVVPTRQPTLSEQGDSVCGTTTGGFTPEGTRCAVPFTYASTTYRSCLSFSNNPPLRNDSLPIPAARVPTDLWCPTVAKYNLLTANDWGFCDCFKDSQVTSRPTSLAPAVQFSSAPTLLPTVSPTTSLPTTSPTTVSQTLPPATLAAWASLFDSLNGNEWTTCSSARTNPCSCKTTQVYVTCIRSAAGANQGNRRQLLVDTTTSITEIVLPNNNCNGALQADGIKVLTGQGLTLLNLEGGIITLLPTTTTCQDVCVASLSVCKIGSTCNGSGTSGELDIVPIIVGVVVGVVVLCCLLLICFKCRDRRPSSSKKKSQSADTLAVASTTRSPPSSSKPINPAFAVMVGKAESKSNISNNNDGDKGFAALKDGEDVEANNITLEDAKLAALKLDDAARKDVPDVEAFLENLDLARHIPAMRARAPGGKLDMIFLYKLSEASQRDMGMTMGERVRLKRALDIRKGLANDPVFGTV
ncbi:hypothetical protein BASA81_003108 [Batrachochytrium salamandrivorans]|nr:hypothetical protein BASA81_003108 [Batrachochytrium salamandrivorans]